MRLAVFAVLACCSQPSFVLGQSALSSDPPDSVVYHAFFRQIAAAEDTADSIRAKGKSDVSMRDAYKVRLGLTDAENTALKQIAQDCDAQYEAESSRGNKIVLDLKAKYPKGSDIPAYAVAQINNLERDRQKVMTDCVGRLRGQMGTSGFLKVDSFVRQKVAPKVRRVSLNSAK